MFLKMVTFQEACFEFSAVCFFYRCLHLFSINSNPFPPLSPLILIGKLLQACSIYFDQLMMDQAEIIICHFKAWPTFVIGYYHHKPKLTHCIQNLKHQNCSHYSLFLSLIFAENISIQHCSYRLESIISCLGCVCFSLQYQLTCTRQIISVFT